MSFLSRAAARNSRNISRGHQRIATFSTQDGAAETELSNFYPVYVHHLSKVCLEHLQTSQSEWLEREGLSRGLEINRDGTFTLHFPRRDDGVDSGRIWSSFDAAKKEHWLSVYRQRLVGRFLIKDSLPGQSIDAVNDEVKSTVDKMIRTISEMENK